VPGGGVGVHLDNSRPAARCRPVIHVDHPWVPTPCAWCLVPQVLLPHGNSSISLSMMALPVAAVLLSMALGAVGAVVLGALLRPGSPLTAAVPQSSPLYFR
jgi:hypothetical protein